MDEKYRVRDAYTVRLRTEELMELADIGSVVVPIRDREVELYLDGTSTMHNTEHTLCLGPGGVYRLANGFHLRWFDMLDGKDIVMVSEARLEYEEQLIDRIGGYPDPGFELPENARQIVEESTFLNTIDAGDDPEHPKASNDAPDRVERSLSTYTEV